MKPLLISLLLLAQFATAQTFNAFTTTVSNPSELQPVNTTHLTFHNNTATTRRLTVTCDLQNLGRSSWESATVTVFTLDTDGELIPTTELHFSSIHPSSTTGPEPTGHDIPYAVDVIVPVDQLARYLQAVADGTAFSTTLGRVRWKTNIPTVTVADTNFSIDADGQIPIHPVLGYPNFLGFTGVPGSGSFTATYPGGNPNPDVIGVPWADEAVHAFENAETTSALIVGATTEALSASYTDSSGDTQPGPALFAPFLYSGAHLYHSPPPPFFESTDVVGEQLTPEAAYALIHSGSFHTDQTTPGSLAYPLELAPRAGSESDFNPTEPGLPTTISDDGQNLTVDVTPNFDGSFKPVLLHFDSLALNDKVRLSGSFVIEGIPFALEYHIRPDGNEVQLTSGLVAEATLLLETLADIDNTLVPDTEKSLTLLDLDALKIAVNTPIATFYLIPNIQLDVGASLSASAGLSLPLTTRFEATSSFGFRNGSPFYQPIDIQRTTPELSPPSTYVESSATAELFAEARLRLSVSLDPEALSSDTAPELRLRNTNTYTIDPLGDPWWDLSSDLSAHATFEFDALGLNVATTEQQLGSWTLLQADAGGPLLPAPPSTSTNAGVQQLGSNTSRWARVLDYRPDTSGVKFTNVDLLPVAGTGDLLFCGGAASTGCVHRLSPDGAHLWTLSFDSPAALGPIAFVAESSGGFTALGKNSSSLSLQQFDAHGNLVWTTRHDLPSPWIVTPVELIRRENASGQAEYFVLGSAENGTTSPDQAFLGKFDASGTTLWARTYAAPDGLSRSFSAATLSNDNHLLLAGKAEDAENNDPASATTGNWLARINANTGNLLWQSGLGTTRITTVQALEQSPDHTIYLAGNRLTVVGDDSGSAWVARFSSTGTFEKLYTLSSDPALTGEYPSGGTTPYDTVNDLVSTPNGLWLCGQLAIKNAAGSSAFVTRLGHDLSMKHHVTFGGSKADHLDAILPHPDGFYLGGHTDSFHPWPAADQPLPHAQQWLLNLPFDGMIRFHDQSTAARPPSGSATGGSYYTWPQLWNSAGYNQTTLTTTTTPLDLTPNPNTIIAPVFVTGVDLLALERVPEAALTSLDDFADYHQSDAPTDRDGDSLSDTAEWFLGTDLDQPTPPTTFLASSLEEDHIHLTLPRAHRAGTALPEIYSSDDLVTWFLNTDWILSDTQPLTPTTDQITLSIPRTHGDFFRFEIPSP